MNRARGGSSPHTRGALKLVFQIGVTAGIIPAYAGSTSWSILMSYGQLDHPRIRGEHASFLRLTHSRRGSSPHTRGARALNFSVDSESRIIPAYAGSTPGLTRSGALLRDHPRIRGEHLLTAKKLNDTLGSSPHTRGALVFAAVGLRLDRIIPAYAGSTPTGARLRTAPGDHPRIRGEHSPGS